MSLTEEQRLDIVDSLRVGCTLDVATKAAGTTAAACRELATLDEGWRADLAAAEREGAALAAPAPVVAWADLMALSAGQEAERASTAKPSAKPQAKVHALNPHSADPVDEEGEAWDRFRAEAERDYGPGRWGLYLLQDERLIAGGLPASSAWWRKTIFEFFESELTWLITMAARGMGKSSTLERLLLIIVLYSKRIVPPGQTWECPFMSVIERDAIRRLGEIQSLLLIAHRIEVAIKNQRIKVPDCSGNSIDIVSTAGTVGQASGPTTVGAFFDEAAKGKISPGSANLDSEVIASIVGTSREVVGWTGVRCSSAYETRGAHFQNCIEGTNSENYVATIGADFIDAALVGYEDVARWESAQGNSHGATQIRAFAKTLHPGSPNIPVWVGRPTLTALKSRMKLETLPKDDPELEGLSRFDYWIREYGSMPLSREGGPDFAQQCEFAAKMTARLARRPSAQPLTGPMKHPGAEPGDPRYAGPTRRPRESGNWRTRKAF